jgi:hypothetical protein
MTETDVALAIVALILSPPVAIVVVALIIKREMRRRKP